MIQNEGLSSCFSRHAEFRMCSRRISERAIEAVIKYGRVIHKRKAVIYAVGKREVKYYRQSGINLEPFEGIQVICSIEGKVITAYRNRDFYGLKV